MRNAFYASAIALLGLAAGPVQAMPIAPLSGAAPDITLVAEGCGAGFHRGPHGRLFRNGGAVVVGAPGVVVGAPGWSARPLLPRGPISRTAAAAATGRALA